MEYIDHNRNIARAIVYDEDGNFYFVRAERNDDFGQATIIETAGGGDIVELRMAQEKDYMQLAEMKWLHCEEDDAEYNTIQERSRSVIWQRKNRC